MRAFNQSGNVGDHERAKVSQVNHAKVRFQRRERIVSNLGLRRGNSRNKCRLTSVRKTNETNIRKQLQLELQLTLFPFAATLVITRRAIGRRREVRVPKASSAAACS